MATQYSHGYGMRPPQGWVPPYQGAAPPIPPGVNVNPQQWQTGVWAFNPAFNAQRPPAQHVPWIPGQAWRPQMRQHPQGQQQQQANFNPYKKVIKPPSAEYLAEPLRDNPLGLTNMIPAYVVYRSVEHLSRGVLGRTHTAKQALLRHPGSGIQRTSKPTTQRLLMATIAWHPHMRQATVAILRGLDNRPSP